MNNNDFDEFKSSQTYKILKDIGKGVGAVAGEVINEVNKAASSHSNQAPKQAKPWQAPQYKKTQEWKETSQEKGKAIIKKKEPFFLRGLQVYSCIAFPIYMIVEMSITQNPMLGILVGGIGSFAFKYLFDLINKIYQKNPIKKIQNPKKFFLRGLQVFSCIAVPAYIIVALETISASVLPVFLGGLAVFGIKYFFDVINYYYQKSHQKKLEKPFVKEVKTGNSEVDNIIKEGNEYITQLKFADDVILHEGISECIVRMEKATSDIFNFVKKNPNKIGQIKKFMNYYLPTTLKLLTNYQQLSNQSTKGENIQSTMFNIEEMMETIATAFEKQLDSLFSMQAMDIQADISVFDSILEQEGLKSEQ